jgi:hypothetical protein
VPFLFRIQCVEVADDITPAVSGKVIIEVSTSMHGNASAGECVA